MDDIIVEHDFKRAGIHEKSIYHIHQSVNTKAVKKFLLQALVKNLRNWFSQKLEDFFSLEKHCN